MHQTKDLDDVRSLCRKAFPDAAVSDMAFMEQGTHSWVYTLDRDREIFRIGKDACAAGLYASEAALMPCLAAKVAGAVPQSRYRQVDGRDVSLHRKIAGISMDKLKPAPDFSSPRLAAGIGAFIASLHDITLGEEHLPHLGTFCLNDAIQLDRIALAGAYLQTPETVSVEYGLYQEAAQRSAARGKVTTHGDFNGANILIDPATSRFTGMIDFGGIGLQQPEADFASFVKTTPVLALETIDVYQQKTGREIDLSYTWLTAKMRAYSSLGETLAADAPDKDARIAHYERRIADVRAFSAQFATLHSLAATRRGPSLPA